MKVCIFGSRTIYNYKRIADIILASYPSPFYITEVIGGMAIGVDTIGKDFAESFGIPFTPKPADWTRFGKSAGMKINAEMVEIADEFIGFWDGHSKGTHAMKEMVLKSGKKLRYFRLPPRIPPSLQVGKTYYMEYTTSISIPVTLISSSKFYLTIKDADKNEKDLSISAQKSWNFDLVDRDDL